MQRPPAFSDVPRFPVTGGITALAIIATGASMGGHSIEPLTMNYLAFHGEPWRLVTSDFPHAGLLHLSFNLYWLWTFGAAIEQRYGSLRMTGLVLLLSVGASVPDYALATGGVGLSGVGYGLFGFLWVMSRHDPHWEDAIDSQTIGMFVGWFFLCIILTLTNAMPVANVAHGAGALVGAMIGFATLQAPLERLAAISALVLFFAASGWAATAGRRTVNFSAQGGQDLARLGTLLLERGDKQEGLRLLLMATSMHRTDPNWWYNLGVAYEELGDTEHAIQAYRKEIAMDPIDSTGHGVVLAYLGYKAREDNDYPNAARLYERAVKVDDSKADWWQALGEIREHMGAPNAADAFGHAREPQPASQPTTSPSL